MSPRPDQILRARCIFATAFAGSGDPSYAAFSLRFREAMSDVIPRVGRYWRGDGFPRRMSPEWAKRLILEIPLAAWVTRLQLFDLLADCKLGPTAVYRLLAPLQVDTPSGDAWKFPGEDQGTPVHDISELLRRGDEWGFTGLLGLVREAEATHGIDIHRTYAMALYRALPAIARRPLFRDHIDWLCECVDRVAWRVRYISKPFVVRWPVMRTHIEAPHYSCDPADWPRLGLEDPVLACEFGEPLHVEPRPIPLLGGTLTEAARKTWVRYGMADMQATRPAKFRLGLGKSVWDDLVSVSGEATTTQLPIPHPRAHRKL